MTVVVLVLAAAHLACLLFSVARRVTFPFDYDWLEGAQLLQGYRLAHGLPIYGPVDHGFMAAPYPPVQPAIVALLGSIFGFDFWVGRIVSIGALVAITVLFVKTVWRESATTSQRLVLTAMAAATAGVAYPALWGYLDMARVDSLAFAWVVAAGYLVASDGIVRSDWRYRIGLAAALFLAVYTKQNNAFFAIAAIVALGFRNVRQAVRVAVIFGAVSLAALVVFQLATHGWFMKWMLVMRGHPLVASHLPDGIAHALEASPLTPVVPVLALWLTAKRALSTSTKVWLAMWLAALPACALPILAEGGARNSLISISLLSGLVAMLLVGDLLRAYPRPWAAHGIGVALAALLAVFLPAHFESPGFVKSLVPSARDREDVAKLHDVIRALPGNVIFPLFPFVALRDGKTDSQFSLIAYFDATERGHIPGDMPAALQSREAPWVVMYGGYNVENWVATWAGSSYVLDREIPLDYHACYREHSDTVKIFRRIDGAP